MLNAGKLRGFAEACLYPGSSGWRVAEGFWILLPRGWNCGSGDYRHPCCCRGCVPSDEKWKEGKGCWWSEGKEAHEG